MHRGGIVTWLFILMAVSLLLDIYAYNGMKTLVKSLVPRRRKYVLRTYLFFAIGIVAVFFISIATTNYGRLPVFLEWGLTLFLTFLIAKIFFVVILLLGDIGRLFFGIGRKVADPKSGRRPFFPSRRRFIVEAGILFAAIPFTGFLYAFFKGKYDFRLHKTTLYFDELPAAFDGFTITQLSDIHSGSFDNSAAVQRGVDLAKAQNSDLFVFTGDLVNNEAPEIEPYMHIFSQLKAPFGQFSILGNHDYGDYMKWDSDEAKAANLDKLKAHHAALGYRLLLDENLLLKKGNDQISLIGVQNWGRGFIQIGDIDKALDGVPKDAFKILLSHDPTHWEEKIRYHPRTMHLTLSGHTHGAQFGVESDKLRWSPVQNRYLDWAGLANEKNRYLYVNRGFGFIGFSGRLGIWPEVTVITLKKNV